MADKDNQDTHHVSTPKADNEVSVQNNLSELLDDLDALDLAGHIYFKDSDGTLKSEKHKQEPSLPDTYKKTTDATELAEENVRENEGETVSKEVKKDLESAHEDAPFAAVTNLPDVAAALEILEELGILKG
jgi:hypothetical protein